jgi:DNA-binding transcriptional LysR family regulator
MRIDFHGLEAFLSIAAWGSFRRAAIRLNLSQAALSHRLRKLEENLGVTLMIRTNREVSLTPAGQDLLPVAQSMFKEVSSKLDGLRKGGNRLKELVAIGCLPTVSIVLLPSVLMELKKELPGTTVRVFDNSTAEIGDRVRSGDADFGITIVSVNTWDLEITPLLEDPFVVVCDQSHALAKRTFVNWTDLERKPLIRISAEAGNRILIDETLGSHGEKMTWRYEVQHVATAIGLVRARLGLTVIPKLGLDATSTDGLVAIPLKDPAIARTLGVVTRKGVALSPAAATLLELVRKHFSKRPAALELQLTNKAKRTKRRLQKVERD